MSFYQGLNMFIFSMSVFFLGSIAVYYVINKIYKDK